MSAIEPAYTVRLAKDARDLRSAQRLRYLVFVTELGGSGLMVALWARPPVRGRGLC